MLVVGGYREIDSAELYDPVLNTWSSAGTLNLGRRGQSATLLPGGEVLIVGGARGIRFHGSAEIYDAYNGTWETGDSLNEARSDHAATILPDAQVLVAGGRGTSAAVLSRAELFNPVAGTWIQTSPMNIARCEHTATLLPDGWILVAGGQDITSNTMTSAEMYVPGSEKWIPTGAMLEPRYGHAATLTAGDRVLMTGGYGISSATNKSEIFDPPKRQFELTGSMGDSRAYHAAILLSDARILVMGGKAESGNVLSSAEVFNPGNGSWSPVGAMGTARYGHTATLLPNGLVLVAGGYRDTGALTSAELFDPQSNSWTPTGDLTSARGDHTATLLLDGRVLVVGGEDSTELATAEIYEPAYGSWFDTSSMTNARTGHTAILLTDSRVLISGGHSDQGAPQLDSAELFDPGLAYLPEWQPVLDEPTSPLIVGHPYTFSGSGFLGNSEGSFGQDGSAPKNYPLVLLRRIDNEQRWWLTPDKSKTYTDTLCSVPEIASDFRDPSLVTVFVNGIPGESRMVLVTLPVDLSIDKTVSPGPYLPRHPITYTLAFSNSSIGTAVGVIITDVVPIEIKAPHFTSSSEISPTGTTTFAWTVEGLSPGEVGQITITGIITASLPEGYTIVNTAVISSEVLDTDSSNSSSTVEFAVDRIYIVELPIILNP